MKTRAKFIEESFINLLDKEYMPLWGAHEDDDFIWIDGNMNLTKFAEDLDKLMEAYDTTRGT
jgi:hypothetical protein